jgi:hypothetical protein
MLETIRSRSPMEHEDGAQVRLSDGAWGQQADDIDVVLVILQGRRIRLT